MEASGVLGRESDMELVINSGLFRCFGAFIAHVFD